MGSLSKIARCLYVLKQKIRAGETWYEKHLAEPMLAEVEDAKNGNLPGSYGSRGSQWEEAVTAAARRKADPQIRSAADDYIDALDRLERMENKRVDLAQHFVGNFPGGDVGAEEVVMVTHVTSRPGSRGPAEPRPEQGNFDSWLEATWPAFQDAENPADLGTRLQAKASDTLNSLDPEVFGVWEDQLGCHDWQEVLWRAYEDEYLERYLTTIRRKQQARDDAEAFADELDQLIEALL